MGIVIRQGVKNTIISYVGILIGAINLLWFYPKFISPEEIGLIRLLQDIPTLVAVFLQLGAVSITEKFFIYFKNNEENNNGFLFLLLIYPLIGFLFFLIFFFGFNDFWIDIYSTKSPLLVSYIFYIIPLAFFIMYISVLEAYCRVNFRIVVPSLFREVVTRLFFSVIIVVYAFKLINLNGLVMFFTLSYGISLVFLIGYIKHLGMFFIRPKFDFLNKRLVKEIGKYILFIIPGTAGSLIASKIDTLMLGSMIGLGQTGIYSLAYFIGTVVEIPKRSLSQISIPIISQAWKSNDLETIGSIYIKTALNQLIVGIFIFLGIWINVDEIFALIPNSEIYSQGKYVILFISLSKLVDMATGVNSEIILYSQYYKFNLISIIFLSIITVLANIIFIPYYGINGAAFSFLITIFLYNGMKMWFLWWKYKLLPLNIKFVIIILIAVVTFGIIDFMDLRGNDDFVSIFLNISLKSLILSIVFIGSILYLKVSTDINNIVKLLWNKIFKF